ncbi:receptor-like protein Cf-9 homolog [Punica granatum]|uniref:Receptor-like protein Cf-9 homolog n=2 Tax=Punica granatum TaxID=22663 RepID=A0A6P8EN10_PUNGR|nr:receptor-like protein Cf-9 homolog [Punica granatum]PKI43659.1 hypothetical protein CRG98_035958 [Punica granatum]
MRMRDIVSVYPFLFLFSAFLMILPVAAAALTAPSRQYLSHSHECDALLQFSNAFINTKDASEDYCDKDSSITSYPKTASWKNGSDCCSWDGVTCHPSTKYVIGIDLSCSWLNGTLHPNSTLFSLYNLRWLNLAGNNFYFSQISPGFGIFTGMEHLNLSHSAFSGPIAPEISHLSSLVTFNVSGNSDLTIEDDHSFRRLVGNLTQLRELVLDGIDMSTVSPNSLTNLSSTLTSLSLRDCNLRGIFPVAIFHLSNLRSLSLSHNSDLVGTLPQTNWIGPLVSLDLSNTIFHGSFPASVGNLRSMNYLDLSHSRFTGPIPPALGNLDHLTHLDLAFNNFSGIVDFEMFARLKNLQYLSFPRNNLTVMLQSDSNCSFPSLKVLILPNCKLTEFPHFLSSSSELEELDLSGNKIHGGIPEWFWRVGRDTLASLDLSDNNFTGEIPSSFCQVSSLYSLHFSDNRLNGNIPRCLGNLSNLWQLDASNNSFTGEIPSSICQLSSLYSLYLLGNRLSGTIPNCLGNLSSLTWLELSDNQLQGPLPASLANCTSLEHLNVSYNEMYDTFPHWLLNAPLYSLLVLDLQSNKFHGAIEIPIPPQISYFLISDNDFAGRLPINFSLDSNAYFIDLANNNFEGPLPIPPSTIQSYYIANNKFSGDIPYQVCNATRLQVIDLSINHLTGTIPHCFSNFNASLSILDLRANDFVGQIPDIFIPKASLRTIRLSQNRLRGTLSRSLVHCKNLQVLDLSENELEDHFPYWLEALPSLQVLNLRSNKFHGLVDSSGEADSPFPKLRIFDISANSFSGPLPAKYITNLIAMKDVTSSGFQYMDSKYGHYQDSITVVMKGSDIELVKILIVFTTIDFSGNFFEGEIPELIGDLKALKGLNLSHNNLTGRIPSSLRNLTNLEWLDLSSNELNGEIPVELADLTSLTTLNLSNNQLFGPIPKGPQIDTFEHSFDRNLGLCGHPLPNACGTDTVDSPPHSTFSEEETVHWIEWRAVPMGYGCGLVLGISSCYIMLETGRPRWLVRMLERKIYRMTKRKRRNVASRNRRRRSPRGQ